MTNDDKDLMPSCLDRQISTADQDAFGHRHFAEALRSLIESEKHAPPFSIGLLGGWGTGKSTIKDLYVAALQDDARKNGAGHARADHIHSITFNAWRFGGREQDVKRALLRHVFLELGGNEERLQDRLFRQVSESRDALLSWRQYTWESLKAWAMPVPAFVLSLFLLVGLLFAALRLLPLEDGFSQAIAVLALTGAYSYLVRQIKSPPVTAHRSITRIDLPNTTAEQYEDLLLDQITRFKSGASKTPDGKNGKACERLVVFVDDLDRLSAEEMVLGLDAVRTFMEIPEARLPKGLGLVFVISCDEARVADALAKGRRHSDLPGTVFTHSDARRYLDRIFQFRLEIPPFPRHDLRQYAIKQMKGLVSIEADLSARGVSVEAIVDRMIHVGVQDPRNALQIVNAFAQAWWLAKKRETEELGTDRPGGLHEGAVTRHPVSLGALSAMRVDFPDFYRELQNDPALLHRLTDVLVRGKPIADQPLATQQILKERYLNMKDENPQVPVEVRQEHRPLRQFLASLVGLRWPESLQSLLLLSEDPVTRKFGSSAMVVYHAFVSGDTQGVLEGLGRHADATPLRQNEARLLAQMVEDLRNESPARRANASRVVADLVERLPKEAAHLLLGSLCRELGDSAELRSQLGISKISKVLAVAHADDQRAVTSRLIEDVLTSAEDVRFRLESMEPPSLEEAVDFARSTVTLALPIRRDYGLDPASDKQLVHWLLERTVTIDGKHYQLPFEELESWMRDHEDHLLSALGSHYIDLLATEFESQSPVTFDVASAVARARTVFKDLWAAGEHTRPVLWNGLTRYVALKQPEATRAASETMIGLASAPSSSQMSEFVVAFVKRLTKQATDGDWDLDFRPAADSLVLLVRTRVSDINADARSALSTLAILWSQNDETAGLSCDILNELQLASAVEAQHVFDNWASRILGDLPIDCVKLVAAAFLNLESSTRSAVITQLRPVIATETIDEATGGRYRAFVESVPESAWDTTPLKEHLDSLAPRIAARSNNPNDYLLKVFPAFAKVLHHVSPGPLGQALYTLFAQAKGQANHYPSLHAAMVRRWPEPSPGLGPYDPVQIFRDGCAFAVATPQSSSKGLLRSLRDMLARKLVSEDLRRGLIDAACATWSANPSLAVSTFKHGFADLTPEQAARLLDAIELEDTGQQVLLADIWCSVADAQSPRDRTQTTNRILEKGTRGPEEEPDRGLRVWLEAQGEICRETLTDAITQPDLNDPHRRRLWRYCVRVADALGPTFFMDVVPIIAALPSIEETAASLFEDYDRVSTVLGSTDNRAELAQRLMKAFPMASTNTVKSHIAEWCKRLSGEAALSQLMTETLVDEDMSILESRFGGTSALKKLKNARRA